MSNFIYLIGLVWFASVSWSLTFLSFSPYPPHHFLSLSHHSPHLKHSIPNSSITDTDLSPVTAPTTPAVTQAATVEAVADTAAEDQVEDLNVIGVEK